MRKILHILMIIVLISMVVILTGCSSKKENEEVQSSSENTIEDLDALSKMEVEKGLFDVTFTIPSQFVGQQTQEELDQVAKENGYKEIKLNEDGSATYVMTKSQHKKLMKETKEKFDTAVQEMVGSEEYPNFTKIEANDNFTDFKVTTKSEELNLSESFSTLTFYMYGGMYSLFDGKEVDNIHIEYINEATGNVIKEANSKDSVNKN